MIEQDPTGLAPNAPGAKLDAGKLMASLLLDFAEALEEVAKVSTEGAHKYSRGGWQHVVNGIERYDDAMWRHLLKQRTEGDFDKDFEEAGTPGIRHDAQVIWNALAALTLRKRAERAQAEVDACGTKTQPVIMTRVLIVCQSCGERADISAANHWAAADAADLWIAEHRREPHDTAPPLFVEKWS